MAIDLGGKVKLNRTFVTVIAIFSLALCGPLLTAFAEEDFTVEVMSLEGTVSSTSAEGVQRNLSEGDILSAGATVEVKDMSRIDIAFDEEWNNVTRLDENTFVRIESVYPGHLVAKEGDIYAKLSKLPKDSEFRVETPTAIATVRGTEYQTVIRDGETKVFNFSDSPVEISGIDESGQPQGEPVVINNSETTQVSGRGERPRVPQRMNEFQRDQGRRLHQAIEGRVREMVSKGRVGKMREGGPGRPGQGPGGPGKKTQNQGPGRRNGPQGPGPGGPPRRP